MHNNNIMNFTNTYKLAINVSIANLFDMTINTITDRLTWLKQIIQVYYGKMSKYVLYSFFFSKVLSHQIFLQVFNDIRFVAYFPIVLQKWP